MTDAKDKLGVAKANWQEGGRGRKASLTRRDFVTGSAIALGSIAVFGLGGCAPKASHDAAMGFQPGTYTASAMGKKDLLTLEVTFSDQAIESISLVECFDTPRIANAALEGVSKSIIENQSLGVDAMTGATLSSTAIIQAVSDCVEQAGGSVSDLERRAVVADDPVIEDLETGIVICGAGGSGMAAALYAAQNGIDVIVLEKASNMGGNCLVSGGWLEYIEGAEGVRPQMTDGYRDMFASTLDAGLAAGVDPAFIEGIQKDFDEYYAAGNTTVFDSTEFYALDYSTRSGGPVIEHWVPYGRKVNALNEWLFDNGYVINSPLNGIVGFPWPRKAHSVEGENGDGFFLTFDKMLGGEDLPITMYMGTPVTDIIKEGGKAVGVVGTAASGNTYNIYAKHGVILATGGYSGNPEMLKKYNSMWPWDDSTKIPTTNNFGHTGDGLVLAEAAGAALAAMDKQMMFPIAGESDYSTESIVGIGGLGCYVNKEGKRFANETADRFTLSAQVMQQTDQVIYIISDADNSGVADGKNEYGLDVEWLIQTGQLFRGQTIEELAGQMGVDVSSLVQTIEQYNKIAAGEAADEEFGRQGFDDHAVIDKAPFYASPRTWAAHVTMGGVAVNSAMQAVDAGGNPIEGLYCVGECSNGNNGISSMCTGHACIDTMLETMKA